MIDLVCTCGQHTSVEEESVGQSLICPNCQGITHVACAEALDVGAGAADFDATLVVQEGPASKGECFALGGVADIEIGKQAKHIRLAGTQVSRLHCTLRRVDFGPSRWQVVDNNSTNGLFVNADRVKEVELNPGDEVQIGEFLLRYHVNVAASLPPVPAMAVAAGGSGTAASLPPLPPMPRAPMSARPTEAATAQQKTNDGWSADESPTNKLGIYIVMLPSIFAAVLASGFIDIEVPVGILCVVVGLAGIVGGIVNIMGRGPVWAGALIGLVMSLGGFGAVAWWMHGRERVYRLELALAFIIGALPGFGLQALLQRVLKRTSQKT